MPRVSLVSLIPVERRAESSPQTLRERLVWLMMLRVGLISVLLGATLILNYGPADSLQKATPRFLLGLIAGTYLATIIFIVWYKFDKAILTLTRVQFLFDICLWGCLVYATGGVMSGFAFLFDLSVILAAVVIGGRAAYQVAGVAAVLVVAIAALNALGVLPPLPDQPAPEISASEATYFLAINLLALFLVAALVNSLVARIERTDRGLAAERTRRADLAQLHADMIRSLTVGIATTGGDGEILMINPAGQQMLKLSAEDIRNTTLFNWLPDIQAVSETDEGSLRHGRGLRGNGTRFPVEFIVAPLVGSTGARRGSIVVFSDLTEVKRLEAEVERSRKLAVLGELAASVAHEIRNPLGAISGSFQMLSSNPALGKDDRSLIDIIERELRRMERLVADMVEYARPHEMRFEEVDLSRVIDETVRVFLMGEDARDREVTVHLGAKSEQPFIARVDQAQIRQVIWNLLRNAAQATEGGDRIDIELKKREHDLYLEVRDSGRGMTPTELKKVFEPFFSTREHGLGLGLALCKRIIAEHGGAIEARSEEGRGSTFAIALPAAALQDGHKGAGK